MGVLPASADLFRVQVLAPIIAENCEGPGGDTQSSVRARGLPASSETIGDLHHLRNAVSSRHFADSVRSDFRVDADGGDEERTAR